MSVSLTKETAGLVHITITRGHPNPLPRVRDCARATFPRHALSITAVAPEIPLPGYNFAPAVVYTVTAFRPAQSV